MNPIFEFASIPDRTIPEAMGSAIARLRTRAGCSRCQHRVCSTIVGDKAVCSDCGRLARAVAHGHPDTIRRAMRLADAGR